MDVATDFWGNAPTLENITDKDRAFIQRALLIAIDKSEKAGFLFDVYASATKASVKGSVKTLVKSLAKRTAKRWFKKYIDDTPKISPVGKSAVQGAYFTMEWRVRMGVGAGDSLDNYLLH